MPPRDLDDQDRLEHILAECNYLLDILPRITRERLDNDGTIFRAICYAIVIIGEAGHHLSHSTKEILSDFEWKQAYQMRNFLVHQYDFIDRAVVWSALEEDVPNLKALLDRILLQKHG